MVEDIKGFKTVGGLLPYSWEQNHDIIRVFRLLFASGLCSRSEFVFDDVRLGREVVRRK
jgi:hypothetical protein